MSGTSKRKNIAPPILALRALKKPYILFYKIPMCKLFNR